jgi:subtilisin-like proprotein convertase family protein
MKTRFLALAGAAGLLLTFCLPAPAALTTVSQSYSPSMPIPDYTPTGVGIWDSRTFSMPGATSISSLDVTLNIQGGYNGDYYAFLRCNNGGFCVLLNRVGVTDASNPGDPGYADSGLNVTFSDSASNGDIHLYQNVLNPGGSALTGTWQPDGRIDDPALVKASSQRPDMLSSFNGVNPNGLWTLFVIDNSPGFNGTLESWGLSVTANVVAVPELSTGFVGLLALAFTALWPVLWSGRRGAC